jgi:hypothetical protein
MQRGNFSTENLVRFSQKSHSRTTDPECSETIETFCDRGLSRETRHKVSMSGSPGFATDREGDVMATVSGAFSRGLRVVPDGPSGRTPLIQKFHKSFTEPVWDFLKKTKKRFDLRGAEGRCCFKEL